MADERQPWDRMDGEPKRSFQRLELFRLMGQGRSLLGLANQIRDQKGQKRTNNIPGATRRAAEFWRWKERAEAWDKHLVEEAEAHWKAQIMGPSEVLARLSEEARVSIGDFIKEVQVEEEVIPGIRTFVTVFALNWEEIQKRGHLIKSITMTANGPKIELYDGQAALVNMARHYKLLTDQVDMTSQGKPIQVIEVIKPEALEGNGE